MPAGTAKNNDEEVPMGKQPGSRSSGAKKSRKLIMPVLLALLLGFWAAWDEALLQPPIIWVFLLLWTLTLMSYAHVSLIAPGCIPASFNARAAKNEQLRKKYCTMCTTWKPVRAKHCSVCETCILGMDHHCPWVGNCVGFRNRKFFMQFVTYVWLLGNVFALGLFQHLVIRWSALSALYRVACLAFLAFCAYTSYSFYGFWRYHVELVCNNQTTLEEMFADKSKPNELDCGLRVNLEQVFGRWLCLAWVPLDLPLLRPVGDGTFWPTQTLVESEPLLPVVEVASTGQSGRQSAVKRNRALLMWAQWVGGASWAFGDDDNDEARQHELLAELFDLHDLDGSGTIEEKELEEVAKGFAQVRRRCAEGEGDCGTPLVPKNVPELFRKIDANQDGKIDRREFCDFYKEQLHHFHDDPRGQLYILQRFVEDLRASRGDLNTRSGTNPRRVVEYVAGERIKVWSKSSNVWVDGKVSKVFKQDTFCEGYAVRAGSYKVSTASGYKWISAHEVSEQMKKLRG
eukprot:TRINITY_DN13621_c0_g4_i1.p1 TRINITY_DN13621_c0_g4~~TRINITY_DN13621_c0_g4_i1.p1  ORF type:complete len:514 (-),score=107.71 TRINITY_DN13621_c0_g4_i1:43-1584(-)